VLADAGEQQHPRSGDGEAAGEREPDTGAGDQVGAGVHAGGDRPGEGQECEAGLQRARSEHVLEVQRGQQEGPEQHGRGGQHHQEAAADGAIGQALHAQERLLRVQLDRGESGEAGECRGADAERLHRGPAGVLGLGKRVHERAEARRGEERAAHVQSAPARPNGVGRDDVHRRDGQDGPDGQVDEEDRAPVD
jgi:hypothetical protein